MYDARVAANYLPSAHRIKMGNWMKKNKNMMAASCVGAAFVTKSIIHKMLLKAIFAIQSPPVPYNIFSKYEEAEKWLQEQLAPVANAA